MTIHLISEGRTLVVHIVLERYKGQIQTRLDSHGEKEINFSTFL